MSHVKTDKLSARTASGTITLGESGETFSLPSGVTLSGAGAITVPSGGSLTIDSGATITNNGTFSGFGKPYFTARLQAATQTISNATWTKVIYDTSDLDSNSAYSTSTGLFTVPSGEAGRYLFFTHNSLYGSGFIQYASVALYKNGSQSTYHQSQHNSGTDSATYVDKSPITYIFDLSVGDTVGVYVYIGQHNPAGFAQILSARAGFGGFKIG